MLHNTGTDRFGIGTSLRNTNAGYTYIGLKLDKYYAQLTNNESMLGLRNNSSNGRGAGYSKFGVGFGNKTVLQPIIIRDIGERWGIGKPEKPLFIASAMAANVEVANQPNLGKNVVKSYFNVLDDIGSRIYGREPSVFLDRYYADIRRINGVTNAMDALIYGSTFVKAQAKLQKLNPFEQVTTTKYAISNDHMLTITPENFIPKSKLKMSHNFGNTTLAGIEIGKQTIDLSGAVNLSDPLFDSKVEMNPRAYNPISVFSVPGTLGIHRNAYFDLSSVYNDGNIADFISKRAVMWAMREAPKFIRKVGEWAGDEVVPWLRKKWPAFDEKLKKAEDIQADFKGKIKAAEQKTLALKVQAKKTETRLKEAKKKWQGIARKFTDPIFMPDNLANLSKGKLNQLNIDLSDIGVDKVNLIPYGDKSLVNVDGSELTYDQLDYIPFKFRDAREAEGGHIVFRAILSGITDTFAPEYSSERYVGRPDSVHVYQGTNREISFTFDVYPKSDTELVTLWEKLNYLAGLTYPHWSDGMGMISPFTELTIGNMYKDTPGYISGLTYTVQDNGTWETTFTALPKYIQVNCTFVYVGKYLPSATQKHFELPWVAEELYVDDKPTRGSDWNLGANLLVNKASVARGEGGRIDKGKFKNVLGAAGL